MEDAEKRVLQAEAELKKAYAGTEEARRYFSQELKEYSDKAREEIKAATREAVVRVGSAERSCDRALEEKRKCEKSVSDQISNAIKEYKRKASKGKGKYLECLEGEQRKLTTLQKKEKQCVNNDPEVKEDLLPKSLTQEN